MHTIHKLIVMGGLFELVDTSALFEDNLEMSRDMSQTRFRLKDIDEPEPSVEEANNKVSPIKVIAEWDDSGFDDDVKKGNNTHPLQPLFGKIYVEGNQLRFSGMRMDASLYTKELVIYVYDQLTTGMSGEKALQNLKDSSRRMNWIPIALSEITSSLKSIGNDRNKTAINLAHMELYKIKKNVW
jgi:hypothetical protein